MSERVNASASSPSGAPLVVVMGVSGCGKTTVGRRLAEALGVPFVEGDELHPPRNVERMRAGIALTDEDRAGWLDAIAGVLARARDSGVVVSCSALKRRYRDRLREAAPDQRLVYLYGDAALLAERLAERKHEYMPPMLLPSQLAALEPPQPDERALAFDIVQPPEAIAAAAQRQLQASP